MASVPAWGAGGRGFESRHPDKIHRMHYVYIIRSVKDGKYYIGETSDIITRLNYHNSGKQRSTKSRIPFELVLSEEYMTREEALRREKQIKSWKGGEAFKRLIRGV